MVTGQHKKAAQVYFHCDPQEKYIENEKKKIQRGNIEALKRI